MRKTVGVMGAGTMGIDVSIDLILHGYHVVLVDISDAVLAEARQKMKQAIKYSSLLMPALKAIAPEYCDTMIQYSTDIIDLQACELIIENVTEDLDIKRALYTRLSEVCSEETFIAVNTSCCSITLIGSVIQKPERIIGVHLMNPVYLKSTAEVIMGYYTTSETLEFINQFLKSLDKNAIVVEDMPGFVSNRISHLFMNEAAFVVYEGVAKPEQVDTIFRNCFGHKMGPLQTADLIGLDTVLSSLNVLYESYQDSKFRQCPLLKKMVDAGLLGRKTGRGFYEY